jgi:hypothetical protein
MPDRLQPRASIAVWAPSQARPQWRARAVQGQAIDIIASMWKCGSTNGAGQESVASARWRAQHQLSSAMPVQCPRCRYRLAFHQAAYLRRKVGVIILLIDLVSSAMPGVISPSDARTDQIAEIHRSTVNPQHIFRHSSFRPSADKPQHRMAASVERRPAAARLNREQRRRPSAGRDQRPKQSQQRNVIRCSGAWFVPCLPLPQAKLGPIHRPTHSPSRPVDMSRCVAVSKSCPSTR